MRKYNSYSPYNRPKLPRNKWGLESMASISSSSSIFGADSSASSVGADMNSLSDFVGATEFEDGIRGLVPAPAAGENSYFLQGTGSWREIPAYKWMSEFPVGKGFTKTGLQVNGDLNITDTLTTMNLEVQGAAHFWSLIIDEVKSHGGQVIVSPSNFTVDYVGDIYYWDVFDPENQYTILLKYRDDIRKALSVNDIKSFKCRRLYQRNDDSSKRITNQCQVGDMLRCRQFNIEEEGIYNDVKNEDWWSFVARTSNSTTLSENQYTDSDGNTYPAIWIDLVYALEKIDGSTVPLSSILSTSEANIEYPSYWDRDIVADELKRVSQKTLDGTEYTDNELYDPEEWKDITDNVIKIRGFDDSISTLVGVDSVNSVDNTNINSVSTSLDMIANGQISATTPVQSSPSLSTTDYSELILTGSLPSSETPTTDPESASSLALNTVSGIDEVEERYKLVQDKTKLKSFVIAAGTTTEVDLIATSTITDTDDNVYNPGDTVPSGITFKDDGFVTTTTDDTVFKKYGSDESEEDATTITDPVELNQIENESSNTGLGTDRDIYREVNLDYNSRTEWRFGYGEFGIKAGDELVCLGHLFNQDRENAIVISSTNPIDPDLVPPAIAQYNFIDTFGESISKYRMTAIASNGNEFIGSFLVSYKNTYLDINERINMMITDVKTGLESVGIHLDGENSTITLVGSVDLRQHASGSYDTLNLYDSLGTKRVEISPFDIPSLGSPESQIDYTKKNFVTVSNSNTATSEYIRYRSEGNQDREWINPFEYYRLYNYWLENYVIYVTSNVDLGYIESGSKLDIRNLNLKFYSYPYLDNRTYEPDRGNGTQQGVTSLKYKLKRDGKTVSSGTITNPSVSGTATDTATIIKDEVLNNFSISTSGSYTLELTLGYKIYAYVRCYYYYNNYYYKIYYEFSGSVIERLDRSETGPDKAYKMSIGTNGFEVVVDNSRSFHIAKDAFQVEWDNAFIRFDSSKGMQIKRRSLTITSSTNLSTRNDGNTYEIIYANYGSGSYTLTLPKASSFGESREISIYGWIDGMPGVISGSKFTVSTAAGDNIEVSFGGYIPVTSINFNTNTGPYSCITLISNGVNLWKIKSAI